MIDNYFCNSEALICASQTVQLLDVPEKDRRTEATTRNSTRHVLFSSPSPSPHIPRRRITACRAVRARSESGGAWDWVEGGSGGGGRSHGIGAHRVFNVSRLKPRTPRTAAMAFMVKHVVGGQLKNLTGGLKEEKPEGEKSEAAAQGMTQEEFEQYQQQLEEEKQEREAEFAQKKAERATVRTHFREKYRLPKNELDETQIQQAGDDVVLPTELAKMIAEDNQEEAHKQSVLGQLSNIQNVDIDQLKDKAQATLEDLKKQTENCSLM
ncbi:hypothetical protein CRENBAI_004788 [Crenichthys baileyi]|uniref:Complexin-3 Complexin III n=1 Tax=Crenichthys baileyi TaxID=28760 RepID=A0AAV9R1I4_9TELE